MPGCRVERMGLNALKMKVVGLLGLLWLMTGQVWAQEVEPPTAEEAVISPNVRRLLPLEGLSVIYTGLNQGIGREWYRFSLYRELEDGVVDREGVVQNVEITHGALARDAYMVWSDDWSLDGVRTILEGPDPVCDDPVLQPAVVTEDEFLWIAGVDGPNLEALTGEVVRELSFRRCRSELGELQMVHLEGATDVPPWELRGFELRTAVRMTLDMPSRSYTAHLFGLPRQEASRQMRTLQDLRSRHPHALYVDAGDFVDGPSVVSNGQRSIYRSLGFQMLRRLKPDALVPGPLELSFGAKELLTEGYGLPYFATNWETDDPALQLPKQIVKLVQTPQGPRTVMFFGVIDPEAGALGTRLAAEGITLRSPIEALQEAIDGLDKLETPPDAVIVISNAQDEMLSDLRLSLRGVDVLIGDPNGTTFRLEDQLQTFRAVSRYERAAPITLPMDGVAVADLRFDKDGRPQSLRMRTIPVTALDPRDEEIAEEMTRIRLNHFQRAEEVLLGVDPQHPLRPLSREDWGTVVCEAVRSYADADMAFIRVPERGPLWPGPMTVLGASVNLAASDVVQSYRIDGDRMNDVLQEAGSRDFTVCGGEVGVRQARVAGRTAHSDRNYRIATTDMTARATGIQLSLDNGSNGWVGQLPKMKTFGPSQSPVTLQEAVIEVLSGWKAAGELEQWKSKIMLWNPADKRTEWLVKIQNLSVQVSGFQGMNKPELSQVTDTLVTSPSSATIGVDVDATLEYYHPKVRWELSNRLAYSVLRVADEKVQESQDLIQLSTTATIPALEFPRKGQFRLAPYGQILFESEFTPVVNEEGDVLPRRADTFFTLGLSTNPSGWLRQFRLGAFVSADFARLDQEDVDVGARLEAETRNDFFRANSVRLTTKWDLRAFGQTPNPTPDDLWFRFFIEGRLGFRIVRWLDLSTYVQTLMVYGRAPENGVFGISYTLGVSLDIVSTFLLSRRAPRLTRGGRVR